MSFFRTLIKDLPAMTTIAADGLSSSEFDGYINTGSYTLNAALSGSLFGGMPNNKITVFAGDPATGKTFFVLGVIKQWMEDNPDGGVIYFDTESAVTNQMLSERGIDLTRLVKSEPETIEQFRQTALQILDRYEESIERQGSGRHSFRKGYPRHDEGGIDSRHLPCVATAARQVECADDRDEPCVQRYWIVCAYESHERWFWVDLCERLHCDAVEVEGS